MAAKVWGIFIFIIFMLFLVFVISFQYVSVADSDNETAVVNSARNAMTEAINLGNARVNEEITINEEIAIEAVLRQYASTTDFFDAARYLNVYEVSSDPAMFAVESYVSIGTPIKPVLNHFTGNTDKSNIVGRSREIVIFEAKQTVKP